MSELSYVLPTGEGDRPVSLKGYEALIALAAGGNRMARRVTTDTHEEFLNVLYEDLDEIICDLEGRKKYFADSSEDQVSDAIVASLNQYGYLASHDKDHSGHVDITVEVRHKRNFKWLGEAKIDHGPSYCWGGYLQLTTRYSVARNGADAGGILIYLQGYDNAADRLEKWAVYLENEKGITCDRTDAGRPGLAFTTSEIHTGTGVPYYIRHMIVFLRHDPQK
ncbi:hypothetical protein [Pandoraea pnomenusa]|uniref:hypothetical protein n=1 Tax=Pandoraea pnomenusa TaxID=93220 RepID=UPI0033426537